MLYFYESHLGGGIYTTDYEQDYDDLYCEECGDSDQYLGEYESWEDFIKDMDPAYWCCFCIDELAKESGLSIEKIYELNPGLKYPDRYDYYEPDIEKDIFDD